MWLDLVLGFFGGKSWLYCTVYIHEKTAQKVILLAYKVKDGFFVYLKEFTKIELI